MPDWKFGDVLRVSVSGRWNQDWRVMVIGWSKRERWQMVTLSPDDHQRDGFYSGVFEWNVSEKFWMRVDD